MAIEKSVPNINSKRIVKGKEGHLGIKIRDFVGKAYNMSEIIN